MAVMILPLPFTISFYRDPSILVATLKVLSAMCTPPIYRYKGNNVNTARSHLADVLGPLFSTTHQQSSLFTSAKKPALNTARKIQLHASMTSNSLEQVQKSIRIGIRSLSGITALVQLIYYKKNQFYMVNIRLETVKVSYSPNFSSLSCLIIILSVCHNNRC